MPRFGKTSIIIKNETDKNDPSMSINLGSCVINRYLAAYRVATTTYCCKQLYTCKQTTKSQNRDSFMSGNIIKRQTTSRVDKLYTLSVLSLWWSKWNNTGTFHLFISFVSFLAAVSHSFKNRCHQSDTFNSHSSDIYQVSGIQVCQPWNDIMLRRDENTETS